MASHDEHREDYLRVFDSAMYEPVWVTDYYSQAAGVVAAAVE